MLSSFLDFWAEMWLVLPVSTATGQRFIIQFSLQKHNLQHFVMELAYFVISAMPSFYVESVYWEDTISYDLLQVDVFSFVHFDISSLENVCVCLCSSSNYVHEQSCNKQIIN